MFSLLDECFKCFKCTSFYSTFVSGREANITDNALMVFKKQSGYVE